MKTLEQIIKEFEKKHYRIYGGTLPMCNKHDFKITTNICKKCFRSAENCSKFLAVKDFIRQSYKAGLEAGLEARPIIKPEGKKENGLSIEYLGFAMYNLALQDYEANIKKLIK
ncbi:MAG TPA: hypothetical protein VF974_04735 [Patescibacteria group bacterium]